MHHQASSQKIIKKLNKSADVNHLHSGLNASTLTKLLLPAVDKGCEIFHNLAISSGTSELARAEKRQQQMPRSASWPRTKSAVPLGS